MYFIKLMIYHNKTKLYMGQNKKDGCSSKNLYIIILNFSFITTNKFNNI